MNSLNLILPQNADDHLTALWKGAAILMLAVWVAMLPTMLTDMRLLDGVSVWAKPAKFSLSLAIHFFTLAILLLQLDRSRRTNVVLLLAGYAAVIAMLFEQFYITLQAAQARRSHFNFETDFESLMYAMMGIGALLLITAPVVLGLMIWRKAKADGSAFRLGSILGLLLAPVLTLVVAGHMSGSGSHWVGQTAGDATGMPLFGWSREAGDMRIAHFFATHAMQILPLLGWFADRRAIRSGRRIVWLAALVNVIIVVAVFALALAGKPLLPL